MLCKIIIIGNNNKRRKLANSGATGDFNIGHSLKKSAMVAAAPFKPIVLSG